MSGTDTTPYYALSAIFAMGPASKTGAPACHLLAQGLHYGWWTDMPARLSAAAVPGVKGCEPGCKGSPYVGKEIFGDGPLTGVELGTT